MNILGMGTLEILVILLLAFIFLGPSKMVDAARILGKASREVRRMATEFSTAQLLSENERGGSERHDPGTLASKSKELYESKADGSITLPPGAQTDDFEEPKGQSSS